MIFLFVHQLVSTPIQMVSLFSYFKDSKVESLMSCSPRMGQSFIVVAGRYWTIDSSVTPKIWKLILPTDDNTFLCWLVLRIWCYI